MRSQLNSQDLHFLFFTSSLPPTILYRYRRTVLHSTENLHRPPPTPAHSQVSLRFREPYCCNFRLVLYFLVIFFTAFSTPFKNGCILKCVWLIYLGCAYIALVTLAPLGLTLQGLRSPRGDHPSLERKNKRSIN